MSKSHHQMAREVGADIAYRIRAELVCCTVYGDLEEARETWSDDAFEEERAARGHDMCYWGEASARLAESHHEGIPKYKRRILSDDQVIEMRRRYKTESVTYGDLARDYGIANGTVAAILYGWVYKSVGDPADFVVPTPKSTGDMCTRGHAFTPENTKIRKRPNGRTTRECRTCIRARRG